jgi:hypothetical protein
MIKPVGGYFANNMQDENLVRLVVNDKKRIDKVNEIMANYELWIQTREGSEKYCLSYHSHEFVASRL